MLYTEETYKPRKFFAALPLIAPFVMAFFYSNRHPEIQLWIGWVTIGSIVLAALIYLLLRAVSVGVGPAGMRFRAVGGERLLPWPELRSAHVRKSHNGKTTRWEFVFHPREGKDASINAKLYSRRSLQGIASALLQMAPHADADDLVRDFAKGKFPFNLR